jgi:Flp pilus assembly protein TadG
MSHQKGDDPLTEGYAIARNDRSLRWILVESTSEARVSHGRRHTALADQSGQVLVLAAVGMVMMLAVTGFALDIGHAYLVQRQLQAGVDAAALAGAQHLPVAADVISVANDYGPSTGAKNATTTVTNATTTVTMRCVQSAPGCQQATGNYNAVRVDANAPVRTLFGRVIGINSITVKATATACSPCTAKPLDIVIALDRTGSMCQTGGGTPDPSCTDLNNARNGIRTFLGYMDPTIDFVGLELWPPALDQSFVDRCPYTPWDGTSNPNRPPNRLDGKYYAYDAWWPYWIPDPRGSTPSVYTIASMSNDYLVQSNGSWILNPSSKLIQNLGCANGAGNTHYASAIEEAQHELDRNGRGTVQDVIIFVSDGAANSSNVSLPNGYWRNTPAWITRPCGSGVEAAARIKAAPRQPAPTVFYTIGYDLDAGGAAPERCRAASATTGHATGSNEACGSWGCTAYDAIRAIASDPTNFYNKPDPGQLNTIFARIAADLQRPAARLIDDNSQ